eukprot:6214043-Pleurochrysis_carterae.AAC.3
MEGGWCSSIHSVPAQRENEEACDRRTCSRGRADTNSSSMVNRNKGGRLASGALLSGSPRRVIPQFQSWLDPIATMAPRAATLIRIDSMDCACAGEQGRGWCTVSGTSKSRASVCGRESSPARVFPAAGAFASREESCSRAESSSPCIAVSASRAELSSR